MPLLMAALVVVTGWTVAYLVNLVIDSELGVVATALLVSAGVGHGVATVGLWGKEPKLTAVLRRRATLPEYVSSRWRLMAVKFAAGLIATNGVAALVFGPDQMIDFWTGRAGDALAKVL